MARVRVALYLGEDQQKLGPGKVRLLEAIRDEGSISAAARALGMAYRHAWELVDQLNRCFAEPVVASSIGGRTGGGAELTPWGEELIRRFHRIESASRGAIERDLAELDARLATAPPAGGRSRSGSARSARRSRPPGSG